MAEKDASGRSVPPVAERGALEGEGVELGGFASPPCPRSRTESETPSAVGIFMRRASVKVDSRSTSVARKPPPTHDFEALKHPDHGSARFAHAVSKPPPSLASVFAASLGTSLSPEEAEALESAIAALVQRARDQWPGVELEAEAFVRHLASRLPRTRPLLEALSSMATDDLYLAFACARRDGRALAAFDRAFLRDVRAFVSGVDPAPAFADEVRQQLRERLLAGTAHSPPKIAEYAGSGALGGWVRVAALRIALNLKRGASPTATEAEPTDDALGAQLGPELAYLKAHYRGAFSEALRDALAGLSDRDRTLLRLYHVEALSLDAIAALYRVHLSTVSRWLSRAREEVAQTTTRTLCERLGVGASAAQSIAALVLSQVDLSLIRLLDTPD